MKDTITHELLEKYFSVTKRALTEAEDKRDEKRRETASIFFEMAQCYYNDALYFLNTKKDMVLAFAALNYAHGWLDAGARIGLFLVQDSQSYARGALYL